MNCLTGAQRLVLASALVSPGKAGERTVDHGIIGGQRNSEVTSQLSYRAGQAVNFLFRQKPYKSHIVSPGRLGQQVEGAFRVVYLVTNLP